MKAVWLEPKGEARPVWMALCGRLSNAYSDGMPCGLPLWPLIRPVRLVNSVVFGIVMWASGDACVEGKFMKRI